MTQNPGEARLIELHDPSPNEVAETPLEFLRRLGGPGIVTVKGRDRSRWRALAVLLHGNEPSGFRAAHQWLRRGDAPAANTLILIGAVAAALAEPAFSHRFLPGHRDLNRCFASRGADCAGRIAANLLDVLARVRPESLIDVHNTSGTNPAFGIATIHDSAHEALVTPFSHRLVVTDIRLGTLMEETEQLCPAITVECGAAVDAHADGIAFEGIRRYLGAHNPLACGVRDLPMEVLRHPVRVRVRPDAVIAYGDRPREGIDVMLRQDIEGHNFGETRAGDSLGWLGPRGLDALTALDSTGRERIRDLFVLRDGTLVPARTLRLSMVTPDPVMARNDCLFYAVAPDD